MADRYGDILRGARLKVALDNYIKYLSGEVNRQPNIGKGKPRAATTTLYVDPFGTKLAAKQSAQVNGPQEFWNSHKPKFSTYTKDTLDTKGGEISLKIKGFRAARASYKTGINPTGVEATSNATKMKYLKYGGTSQSLPFGQAETFTTESAAFEAIKTAFGVTQTTKAAKVYWQREKY
jgi:hypothetical protein